MQVGGESGGTEFISFVIVQDSSRSKLIQFNAA